MVKFDETLDGRNEAIKNKDGQENKVNIRGFSLGPLLEEVLNEFENKGINPTFDKIITELRKRSPQDFKVRGENVFFAYLLSRLEQDGEEVYIYFAGYINRYKPLIRVFGVDKIGYVYEMGIGILGNDFYGHIPAAEYLTMTSAVDHRPHMNRINTTYRIETIYKMLDTLHYTLKRMGLPLGIGDMNTYEGDFLSENIGKVLYPGKINLAGMAMYEIMSYVRQLSGKR